MQPAGQSSLEIQYKLYLVFILNAGRGEAFLLVQTSRRRIILITGQSDPG